MSRRALAAPTAVTARLLRSWPLPELSTKGGKEQRGSVLVVGGSREVPGAVLLAGTAALRAGAGRLQLATAKSAALGMSLVLPEARVLGLAETRTGELASGSMHAVERLAACCQCLVIGPGMGEHSAATSLVRHARRHNPDAPVVVDAAALRSLGDRKLALGARQHIIATPHAGEMADLLGISRETVEADSLAVARGAAAELGVIVVLKGAVTVIVTPDGRAFRNDAGNAGLGTSGSGDVLAGIIGGLAARGAEAAQAAVWGVFLHAKAGEALAKKVGGLGYLAREICGEVPRLLEAFGGERR